MTKLLFSILLFGTGLNPEDSKGTLELRYEPIYCVKEPCPQFRVLRLNGKEVEDYSVDLKNLDAEKIGLNAGQKLMVRAVWPKEGPYLGEPRVSAWYLGVGQDLP